MSLDRPKAPLAPGKSVGRYGFVTRWHIDALRHQGSIIGNKFQSSLPGESGSSQTAKRLDPREAVVRVAALQKRDGDAIALDITVEVGQKSRGSVFAPVPFVERLGDC